MALIIVYRTFALTKVVVIALALMMTEAKSISGTSLKTQCIIFVVLHTARNAYIIRKVTRIEAMAIRLGRANVLAILVVGIIPFALQLTIFSAF